MGRYMVIGPYIYHLMPEFPCVVEINITHIPELFFTRKKYITNVGIISSLIWRYNFSKNF